MIILWVIFEWRSLEVKQLRRFSNLHEAQVIIIQTYGSFFWCPNIKMLGKNRPWNKKRFLSRDVGIGITPSHAVAHTISPKRSLRKYSQSGNLQEWNTPQREIVQRCTFDSVALDRGELETKIVVQVLRFIESLSSRSPPKWQQSQSRSCGRCLSILLLIGCLHV